MAVKGTRVRSKLHRKPLIWTRRHETNSSSLQIFAKNIFPSPPPSSSPPYDPKAMKWQEKTVTIEHHTPQDGPPTLSRREKNAGHHSSKEYSPVLPVGSAVLPRVQEPAGPPAHAHVTCMRGTSSTPASKSITRHNALLPFPKTSIHKEKVYF